MNQAVTPAPSPAAHPFMDAAEAAAHLAHLGTVMEQLLALVEQETALVRAGKLRDSAALEPLKTELARQYVVDTARVKANKDFLAAAMPQAIAVMRERHQMFQALLQINLTVLATAHAVAEGIMRGVSDEVNRKASPQTYGATGRTVAPPRNNAQPLTVSRVL